MARGSPGGSPGPPSNLHLGGQKKLGKKYNIDIQDAHELRSTSITSPLAARPHHGNQ